MITLQVDVEVIADTHSIIQDIEFPSANPIGYGNTDSSVPNAAENQKLLEILKSPYIGAKPFLNSISHLDDEEVYWDSNEKYLGYISKAIFDSSNEVTSPVIEGATVTKSFSFTIKGQNINNLIIMFDLYANQWATKLKVNGISYDNMGPQFVWKSENVNVNSQQDIVVEILKWNKPLSPIRITGLFTSLTMSFGNDCIKSLVRGSQCVADNKSPKFAPISQYGSIVFYDVYNEFAELAEMCLLQSDMNVDIYLKDDASSENITQIGNYISDSWTYDFQNKEVKVNLIDRVTRWESRDYYYSPSYNPNIKNNNNSKQITLIELFDHMINSAVDERFDFLRIDTGATSKTDSTDLSIYKDEFLQSEIGKVLNDINFEYLNVPICSYRDAWQYLCEFLGINAYCDEKGMFKFIKL